MRLRSFAGFLGPACLPAAIALGSLAASCAQVAAPVAIPPSALPAPLAAAGTVTALVGVNVLPMTEDRVLLDQTIIVDHGVLRHIGPTAAVSIPSEARVLNARGKFVLPGMADMHVHFSTDARENQRIVDLSLAHGITLIRGMQGAPEQLGFRARLNADDSPEPTLLLAGPPIDRALTPDAARATTVEQKASGYDFIKIIGGIDATAYDAIIETARGQNIAVIGHLPKAVALEHALAARQGSIEHLMGYLKRPEGAGDDWLAARAERTQEAGVANCPTLDWFAVGGEPDVAKLLARDGLRYAPKSDIDGWTHEHVPGNLNGPDVAAAADRAVAMLSRAGARLLVGSDSPGDFRVPGFAYDEELRHLAHAGVSRFAVLRAATLDAALSLGDQSFGGIVEGMRADLVVVDTDPRADLEALAHPYGVMAHGRWLSGPALAERLTRWLVPER